MAPIETLEYLSRDNPREKKRERNRDRRVDVGICHRAHLPEEQWMDALSDRCCPLDHLGRASKPHDAMRQSGRGARPEISQ